MRIGLQRVERRLLAAVHRTVPVGSVGAAWRPALDEVWAFLQTQPGLRTDGQNVFLYRHPKSPGGPLDVDFGVEVSRPFDATGSVAPVETPSGEAAVAVHRGVYDRLRLAHAAIEAWGVANGRSFAGLSWEVYGDPTPDPAQTETTVYHLLAASPARPARSDVRG